MCFPVSFVKFLRTPFLQKTSCRLLLKNALLNSDSCDSNHVYLFAQRLWYTYINPNKEWVELSDLFEIFIEILQPST